VPILVPQCLQNYKWFTVRGDSHGQLTNT
jgi:hypothetical protein